MAGGFCFLWHPFQTTVKNLVSLMAIIGGLWLLYAGYQREQSLAGKADGSLSRLGQRIDGQGHVPTHVKYFVAGSLLVAGGAIGLGAIRK